MDFLKKDLIDLVNKLKKRWFLIFIPIFLVVVFIGTASSNNELIEMIENNIKNGNFSEAESVLVELEDKRPSSVETFELYADFYLAKNEPESAIEILEKGLKRVPSDSREHLQNRIDSIKSEYDVSDETYKAEPSEEKKVHVEKSKKNYLTEALWAGPSNYVFAVEIDSYNGDIFEKGTYRFYPDLVTITSNEIPVVWDIYVSDELYNSTSQFLDSQLQATVGGINNLEATLELEKGQYVYVIYNEPVSTPTGALKIKKK